MLSFHSSWYEHYASLIIDNLQIDKIAKIGINGLEIKGFGGPELNTIESGAIIYELAKRDVSIASFILVHNAIGQSVIDTLGNEEQRQRMLKDTMTLKKIVAFGLTEPEYGSDATSLKTSAKKVEGGYLLNGQKRWIGNATIADYVIIWAKNEEEGDKI